MTVLEELMDITYEVESSMGVNGYQGGNDPRRELVIAKLAERITPMLDKITDDDLDALTAENYHVTRTAVDVAKGGTHDT